jgi:hypothetical protein
VERDGEVGLHRPTTEDPVFRALSPEDASRVYRKVLGGVTAYLDEMETPKPMIDAMVDTSSSEIHWIESDNNLGLRRPPSIAEWEDASCGSFTNEEGQTWGKLAGKSFDRSISSQEQLLFKMLHEKLMENGRYRNVLLDAQRDRLPPPPSDDNAVQPPAQSTSFNASSGNLLASITEETRNLFSATNRQNAVAIDYLQEKYSEQVSYFGTVLPKQNVLADKKAFFQRWPVRNYSLVANSLRIACDTETACTSEGTMKWTVTNPKATSQGSASFSLGWSLEAGV